MEKPRKPHYIDHRKRLRERFRKTGSDGFAEYELLELLLTYPLPRKDVKPLAKGLLSEFGSLQGVLDAPYDRLVEFTGVKENTATFIHALKGCMAAYLKGGIKKARRISSTIDLLDYCHVLMSGLKDEQFRTIFLNSQNELIADEVIGEGTVDRAVVYPRKVLERALYHKASAIIMVHNHPSGSPKPSAEDKRLTAEVVRAARSIEIAVHDHLIIAKSGFYSFQNAGLV